MKPLRRQLQAAFKTLRRVGVNADDQMVARYGYLYRVQNQRLAMEKRVYAEVSGDIEALERIQRLIAGLKVYRLKASTLRDLQDELERRKAGRVKPERQKKTGRPVDLATRRVLLDYQPIAPWDVDVIEACLILTGAIGVAREKRVLKRFVKKAREEGDHGRPLRF